MWKKAELKVAKRKKQKWVREIVIRLSNRACMMMTFFSCNFPFETFLYIPTEMYIYTCTQKEWEKNLIMSCSIMFFFGAKSQLSTRIEPFLFKKVNVSEICYHLQLAATIHIKGFALRPCHCVHFSKWKQKLFYYQISRSIKQRSWTSRSFSRQSLFFLRHPLVIGVKRQKIV